MIAKPFSNEWYAYQDYRVVVEPTPPGAGASWERICKGIEQDIRRHVDGVAAIYIENTAVCKFCGCRIETADKDEPESDIVTGQPLCCDKAVELFDEWRAEKEGK